MAPVNPASLHLRRATVDDLAVLRPLWMQAGFDVAGFEKRVTEFQIIETVDGSILGVLGFKVSGKEALIHSETFTQAGPHDDLRSRLWERVSNLSRNFGVVRIWTEETAPYWNQQGLVMAQPADLEKLPAGFGAAQGNWRFLQLRPETSPSGLTLDAEFELFKQANQESTERLVRQARVMKLVAAGVAILLFIAVVIAVFLMIKLKPAGRTFSPP